MRGQRIINAVLRRAAKRIGYEMILGSYYAPLPDLEHLPQSHWQAPLATPGVNFRIAESLELLRELAPGMREFPAGSVHLAEGGYGGTVAETLYAILRYFKPSQVVELGSGASSHVIEEARRLDSFEYRIFDPFPWSHTNVPPVRDADVRPFRAEDVPSEEFARLQAGDVLFVDTTHTVKAGGDVNRIVLEVVPTLASGVLVHFHDIFLPYEYPREWVVTDRRLWAEQYLLQAFLAFNTSWDVVLPCNALAHQHPDEMRRASPSFRIGKSPSAFWIRRR